MVTALLVVVTVPFAVRSVRGWLRFVVVRSAPARTTCDEHPESKMSSLAAEHVVKQQADLFGFGIALASGRISRSFGTAFDLFAVIDDSIVFAVRSRPAVRSGDGSA